MFSESAHLYDLIYRQLKDYGEEAARLATAIRDRLPEAKDILDVACGSGEHARHLTELGFQVDGVDIEPAFVEIAAAKNPRGAFTRADMIDLELGRRYDAVLCLFSSIGYVKSVENLDRAMDSLARHVRPHGVVVVEPSFRPGDLTDGKIFVQTAQEEGIHVCRMSRTEVHESLATMRFEYLVGDARGIRRAAEVHELGLFTREEMEGAFSRAGMEVAYDPEGIFGRGLYIGRPRSGG